MNIVSKIFSICNPPVNVLFYKYNQSFSCGNMGLPYTNQNDKKGTLRWVHNPNLRLLNSRGNYKIRFSKPTKRYNSYNLRSNSFWPGPDNIKNITEYKFDCYWEVHAMKGITDEYYN